jgi:capsular polysaccharide biosynthesis protein
MTLQELLRVLHDHLRLVILMPLLIALTTAGVALFLPNKYTASTTMYVLVTSGDGTTTTTTSNDLTASQMITDDVATLMKSDRVKSDTASDLGLTDLRGFKISVTSSTTSRVVTLSVTGSNAQSAADVANAMVKNTSDIAQSVMEVKSVNAIDSAAAPTAPSGPNRPLYVAVALVAGLLAAIAIAVLMETLNTKVRNSEDAEELLGVPVIGHIPVYGGR